MALEMKMWAEGLILPNEMELGIHLRGNEGERIVSLREDGDNIEFREQCDGHYYMTLSKEDAKKAFQEAIDWIDQGCP